jgi:hypothetical protein
VDSELKRITAKGSKDTQERLAKTAAAAPSTSFQREKLFDLI